MATKNFIVGMPKVELHAHLNGSLSTETLLKLGSIVYGQKTDEFREMCAIFKQEGNLSLSDCFKKFKKAHDLTVTKDTLTMATMSVIRDFEHDNVLYLELRTTPRATPNMSKSEYLDTVVNTICSAKLLYPSICVKLLLSIDRSQGKEAASETLKLAIALLETHSDIIKGLDLSGDPACGSFDEYSDILAEARNCQLNLALHCAEIENNKETHKMLQFGMERCGHGTFLSPENLTIIKEKGIPIECCLSSNVKCGTVKSYEDHHFKALLLSQHPVVLCTDDCGVFDTTLSQEFVIAQQYFDLSTDVIQKLSLNAVSASFANEKEKESMRKTINRYFEKYAEIYQ